MTITLPAFSDAERFKAHRLLAAQVARMMGRKLEEDDWATVYCVSKGIPKQGWSNLNLDIMHGRLGVEHKMIKRAADRPLMSYCGEGIMHPSATRSIRIPVGEDNPNKVMKAVLTQYADLIKQRRAKVESQSSGKPADMRTGWLLWQETLKEFLYFEERMEVPDTKGLYAVWNERETRGSRKASRNLWIYDSESKEKKYSVTTDAGAKIQPYFKVPLPDDKHLYHFVVQGEPYDRGVVRMWITPATAAQLQYLVGSLDWETVSDAVLAARLQKIAPDELTANPDIVEVCISESAYERLRRDTEGVSDEHCVQLLVRQLEAIRKHG